MAWSCRQPVVDDPTGTPFVIVALFGAVSARRPPSRSTRISVVAGHCSPAERPPSGRSSMRPPSRRSTPCNPDRVCDVRSWPPRGPLIYGCGVGPVDGLCSPATGSDVGSAFGVDAVFGAAAGAAVPGASGFGVPVGGGVVVSPPPVRCRA